MSINKVFVCADYSQIEARVLAWLARQQDILDVFASGDDVYTYTAKKIGSDNRQLGKVCVLGLGFGMGWKKFVATAGLMGGLDLSDRFAQETVHEWRKANDKIVSFWHELDAAFRVATISPPGACLPIGEKFARSVSDLAEHAEEVHRLKNRVAKVNSLAERPGTEGEGSAARAKLQELKQRQLELQEVLRQKIAAAQQHPIIIERGKDAVGILLPGKTRRLIYRNPRLVHNPESFHPTETDIHYDGVQQLSKKWGAIKTYGGKLAENVTQAVARDVMASGLLRMDEAGLDLRMTVHDEVIAICNEAEAEQGLDMMLKVMREAPPWAPGLPVWAEGFTAKRYRK